MGARVYLVFSDKAHRAYIGKGPDSRIDGGHSDEFHEVAAYPDAVHWESEEFKEERDALIAEAAAIRIVELLGCGVTLVNRVKEIGSLFFPRYPFPFREGKVSEADLSKAIIVTITPDKLRDDPRVAPNSQGRPEELAERFRKFWSFSRERVESWVRDRSGAPELLVAVAKSNRRILGAFEIDNDGWFADEANGERIQAVPLKDRHEPDARDLRGKEYTGRRQGGAFRYGAGVASRS